MWNSDSFQISKHFRQGVMRRVLVLSLIMFAAGCATAPRPIAEVPTRDTRDNGGTATPEALAETQPVVVPLGPVPQVESKILAPNDQPAVPRTFLGLEEFTEANDEKLLNIYVGMSRKTVERLMDGHQSGKWTNPYKHQTVMDADGKKHEVLFYLTRAPRPGQRVTENFLTPVIFQNERVTAIGRYPLKKLRRVACQSRAQGSCP
jgi:hypothetical protein